MAGGSDCCSLALFVAVHIYLSYTGIGTVNDLKSDSYTKVGQTEKSFFYDFNYHEETVSYTPL